MNYAALEIDDLSYTYGSRRALDRVGFTISPGRFVGLLGPNGAGKTTLFALLTRLLPSRAGSIRMFGESLYRRPGRALSQIGVVFQQSTLDLDLSVAQNLYYHAALHGMGRRQARRSMTEQLQRFSMLDRIDDKVRSLNQGHRRRVEFARALLHRPRLLLLDEATVGLDVETRHMINEHVRALCRDQGVAALWASHLVDDIDVSDHLLLLDQGRLISDDDCANVLQQYQAQNLRQLMLNLAKHAA
jgi:ABC-2 type transport system ATP-binding protein